MIARESPLALVKLPQARPGGSTSADTAVANAPKKTKMRLKRYILSIGGVVK